MSEFRPFTLAHVLTVAVCLVAGAGLLALGRNWRHTDREKSLGLVWGGFAAGINVWSIVYWAIPPVWNVRESLPVQLCDIACLAVPFAFIPKWRWARCVLFYWGIGLSTQAFVTPTVRVGVDTERFWLFWLVHFAIVGGALYDLIVRKFRPTWADFRRMLPISAVYLALVLTLNWRLGSNYGYLGNTLPQNRTMVDAAGPWPFRIFVLVAIGVALMAFMSWVGRSRRVEAAQ